jgi:hypothetical protein
VINFNSNRNPNPTFNPNSNLKSNPNSYFYPNPNSNSKPGGSSVSAVASGIFRGLPGGAKTTVDESKGLWGLETEKLLREELLKLFLYLFADIELFLSPKQDGSGKVDFDMGGFMNKRAAASAGGDSRALLEFLSDFLKSTMFSKFCDEKLKGKIDRKNVSKKCNENINSWGKGGNKDEEDDFQALCDDLRIRLGLQLAVGVKVISLDPNPRP